MQMKLSQIAMIPILIQSTLETVSKTVVQFTSATDKQREQHALLEENVDVQSNDDENLTGNEFGCSSEEKTIDIQTSVASEIVSADKYDYDFEDDLSTNLSEVVFTPPPSPDLQLTDEQANKSGQQLKVHSKIFDCYFQNNCLFNYFIVTDARNGEIMAMEGRGENHSKVSQYFGFDSNQMVWINFFLICRRSTCHLVPGSNMIQNR